MQFETKSNLAKLLSEENILVEQQLGAKTAAFDLKNRRLIIPVLKETLSPHVADMFIAHEVGHALFTPTDQWLIAIDTINKSILNVIEDIRIDKNIKSKYPGLKHDYIEGTKELNKIDFMGLSKFEDEEFKLIDKINVYFKIGYLPEIQFSELEIPFLQRAETIETWEDVVSLAQDIQEFMKHELDECDDIEYYEEIESFTQNHMEEMQNQLYSESNYPTIYLDIPDVDLDKIIIHYKSLLYKFRNDIKQEIPLLSKLKNESKDVVSFMVKEFLLKKNAETRKRAKVAKTGTINTNKLYEYKLSDDIFKKSMVVPQGKSHGLVFFLDNSASMSEYMQETLEQLIPMLWFCKTANIPFEVYSFLTADFARRVPKLNNIEIDVCQKFEVKLLNVLSSKMNLVEFNSMCELLLKYNKGDLPGYTYSRTPLNHILFYSDRILKEFQEKNKIQIVNAIYLSDGESSPIDYNYNGTLGWGIDFPYYNIFLRDRKKGLVKLIKKKVDVSNYDFNETEEVLRFIKEYNPYNIFGFRICDTRSLNRHLNRSRIAPEELKKIKSEFRKNNFYKIENTNYDSYYLIRMHTDEDDELEFGTMTSTTQIAKKFTKALHTRTSNKTFLKKFIDFIS